MGGNTSEDQLLFDSEIERKFCRNNSKTRKREQHEGAYVSETYPTLEETMVDNGNNKLNGNVSKNNLNGNDSHSDNGGGKPCYNSPRRLAHLHTSKKYHTNKDEGRASPNFI